MIKELSTWKCDAGRKQSLSGITRLATENDVACDTNSKRRSRSLVRLIFHSFCAGANIFREFSCDSMRYTCPDAMGLVTIFSTS